MVKLDDIYAPSGDFLKADDLKGADPVTATIAKYDIGEWPDGSRRFELLLEFENGAQKMMNCNKTNAKRIGVMYGDNIDKWIGQSVTLFHDPNVEYGGEIKGGLRVKLPEAAPTGKKAAFLEKSKGDEIPF